MQILRRDNQRIAFRETQTIYIENPLKSRDFSGFSGPSDWFRTSGLVVPNRNRKLFSDVSNDFSSFPLVFRYSPTWIDGKKHARNVYAHTREECEEKLKVLIAETKAELAELKRQKGDRH